MMMLGKPNAYWPRRVAVALLGVCLLLFVGACSLFQKPPVSVADPCRVRVPLVEKPAVALERLISGLTRPLYLTHAGDGSGRLFLVEQAGTIRVVKNGALLPTAFLDLRDRVEAGGEKGLLSVAFHPDFQTNRQFYVNYTTRQGGQLQTVIAQYQASAGDPDVADPASARVLLQIDQPYDNHNGGLVLFGPEGYLYIGMGDGGSGGDPQGNGQRLSTLLGKLLRIDVDGPAPPYGIPADNPFVGQAGVRGEIWAYGLRNPWRFSFDRCTEQLFLGDVGESRWEEIDLIVKGGNYGWNIMEGSQCFRPPSGCTTAGLALPIAEYSHGSGCSITGGHLYRGKKYSGLIGHYIFGDFCSGVIWSLRPDGSGSWQRTELLKAGFLISSFGEDEEGELFVVDYSGGTIWRMQAK
jgi:glucose/arabinose dehydrogenase